VSIKFSQKCNHVRSPRTRNRWENETDDDSILTANWRHLTDPASRTEDYYRGGLPFHAGLFGAVTLRDR
jgi:hypothetical protein